MLREMILKLNPVIERFANGDFSSTDVLAVLIVFLGVYWLIPKRKYNLPPGPFCLPIFGYLPFFSKEPYKVLIELSKKYGKVFGLYIGRRYVVVLGDYTSVKEAFGKSTTTDRPSNVFDFIPDGVGFSSLNGEDWVEQRRYVVRAMRDIGMGRTRWEELVQEEVDDFVKLLSTYEGQAIDVCKPLSSSVANNIGALVFGKRIPVDSPVRKFLDNAIEAVTRTANQASARNFFPGLEKVWILLGIGNHRKNHLDMVAFNDYIKNEIEQRKKSETGGESDIFIDEYLKEIENNRGKSPKTSFNEANLRGNTQALIVGGSDTTRTSLNWLFLAMANFPEIQAKVHQELEAVLGKDGQAKWSERSKLPYTFAVIMECQRWMPIVPLNTARLPTEDIKIGEYDVPKNTALMGNYWALHKDPDYWKDPDEFVPERFLTEDGTQIVYKQESYVPFSYGKRNCPGETVAMIEILLYFSAVVKRFEVLPPVGKKPKMEGILGLTFHAVPQTLRFVPRN